MRLTQLGIFVAGLVALTGLTYVYAVLQARWSKKALKQASPRPAKDPRMPNITGAPPVRVPAATDKIISRMINSVDYNMRSLELIEWLCTSLVASIQATGYACSGEDRVDYAGIAASVPRANELTRTELEKHMRALVREACKTARTSTQLTEALMQYAESAQSLLVGMPSYSVKSSHPLPP